jgi:hypothetical protein
MAATKSTKKAKATKTKTTAKKKTVANKTKAKKTKKTKPVKKSSVKKTTAKKSVAKKTTAKKTKKTKKTAKNKNTTKNVVDTFFADIVKQANKVQKVAQSQTKTWIKQLNSQDKQLGQLNKKLSTASSKARTGLVTKVNKLQDQMSTTRNNLLASENAADKLATFSEWTTQLNSQVGATVYLQTTTSTSRPQLVKHNDYEEIEQDDMNFIFGDDDDLDLDKQKKR